MTVGVSEKFPQFSLKAVDGKPFEQMNIDNVFIDIDNNTYAGKWAVYFFYPKDFTFVCPTEIAGFADLDQDFKDRNAQLITGSTDSEFTHWAWRKHQAELKNLPIPMLADIKRELTSALGILDKREGVAQRATFIVDPDGYIRFSMVTDMDIGRNPEEVLRILDALKTGALCPCNWHKGEDVIDLQKEAT